MYASCNTCASDPKYQTATSCLLDIAHAIAVCTARVSALNGCVAVVEGLLVKENAFVC